jgi:hypothetical protein
MASLPKNIQDFMADYGIDSDEIWQVHGTSWVIKHKALERVAAEKNIQFEAPRFVETNAADKIVVLCVTGKMGERSEWSMGEAAPYNNKNSYPYAMAEKRAKDRVILKLLNTHGVIYSEEEADDFKPGNGNGERMKTLPKKDARDIYEKLQRQIDEVQSREQLKAWGTANKDRILILPEDWQDILRLRFEEQMADLRQREAAA